MEWNSSAHTADDRQRRRRYVLWPRIDQKTCVKAVDSAGFQLVPIPMHLHGDALVSAVIQYCIGVMHESHP